AGREVLDGAQRQAVVATIAALLDAFKLKIAALRFHRELGSPKSCPGSGIDKEALIGEIQAALGAKPAAKGAAARARRAPKGPPPCEPRHYLGYELTLPIGEPDPNFDTMEVPEEQELPAATIENLARARALGAHDLVAEDL